MRGRIGMGEMKHAHRAKHSGNRAQQSEPKPIHS
jgi:hypothetical protein